ncbi:CpaF family protein [Paludibacterium purpuratum]|uniref:Pilus assembly protein CpaF n=1 Tax=Paludibacterium purpuratum TaxID=1144873 RepID=A0A4R7B8Z9_9NEIS|nr:CpaF family protein [Paludibacterium purpuratum]TDR80245.1 pilus assembly protein CpaF [Paludibacterium purpuratum]
MFGRKLNAGEAEKARHYAVTPHPTHGQPHAATSSPAPTESAPAEVKAPAQERQATGRKEAQDQLVRMPEFQQIRSIVLGSMNASVAVTKTREQVKTDIERVVAELITRERMRFNSQDQVRIVEEMLNDMFGVGPIEPLLADDTVTDILVNGPDQIYVERHGRLELVSQKFRDNTHVVNVAQRIAASVGRRVDESSPMVDARLADGSRVNVVVPPLAIDGACIAIRKFSKRNITLARMAQQRNMSAAMSRLLEVASACRLNVVISGGTGSGKTTLLNALSQHISVRERIITIEDAAELQLQQPHVVRLETRPENAEGMGQVSQRDLVKNALRMRPDRIILGETRGSEAFDVLQAMNTGHDGSMTTVHANTPRDAITRLESMVMMSHGSLPLSSIRRQISSAVNLIVQVERMRDGMRRITYITELVGMEGEVIITQDLFRFQLDAKHQGDEVVGSFDSSRMRPAFMARAAYYGLQDVLMEIMQQ